MSDEPQTHKNRAKHGSQITDTPKSRLRLSANFMKAAAWAAGALAVTAGAAYIEASVRLGHEQFSTLSEAFMSVASPPMMMAAVVGAAVFGWGVNALVNYGRGAVKPLSEPQTPVRKP